MTVIIDLNHCTLTLGTCVSFFYGGFALIRQHHATSFIASALRDDLIPRNMANFLDYTAALILHP